MTNRKHKAMEEAHRIRSDHFRPKISGDYREEPMEVELMIPIVQASLKRDDCVDMRRLYCALYKKGGETFDQALAIVCSPLYEALK